MVLWILSRFVGFHIRGFHPLWQVFPGPFYYPIKIDYTVRTPSCKHNGLGSSAFARRYWRNHFCFLFLRLLRCFSSPGSLCIPIYSVCSTWSLSRWVAPFRYPRIIVYLPLPAAFRSLSRLSSALSAKASALRPFLLNLLLDLHEMKRNETRPAGLPDRTVELLFMEWTRCEAPLAIQIEDPRSGFEIIHASFQLCSSGLLFSFTYIALYANSIDLRFLCLF